MRRFAASVSALVTALALGTGGAVAQPSVAAGHPAGDLGPGLGARQVEGHTVTLITGDRVRVGAGSTPSITVLPTAGREGVPLRAFSQQGRHYVVPLDAMALIDAGRVDRRLFDVTTLVEFGYTDERTDSVPLIVTYADGAAAREITAGVTTTEQLPAVDGAAAVVRKADAVTAWRSLTTARGIEKVWLDGLRRPSLEHSVPQIGAPAAHDAGFTGTGVRVAVLDTGIDATHPDLAGQVVAAANFTADPDGDQVGHGTHVASTVAGTGAASDGRYRGVAFGASLLDGKVCESFGCPESAILAGMEWAAAEQDADVINMSLGGPDHPETDPLEEAVDRLTAEHGTLFVIAAGNSGGEATVGSPSTADAALSVGAVDREDRLAPFSSRGPRHDGAIKPEITAPGVQIVAARAGSTPDPYLAASGTSMAAPHVAGAAALLAQRNPDWTPAQLKAGLVGTGRPTADAGVFDQGGGRVDVAAAIEQELLAQPATISLGRQQWPHDDDEPVRRQTTIHNTGAADVTLALTVQASGPDGEPAPAGMFDVDVDQVTVPAGGSATVAVTADTGVGGGPDGHYGGRLVAEAQGGATLAVPFAVDKEVESYDVTVELRGFEGSPLVFGTLVDVVAGRFHDLSGDRTVMRLPKGTYLAEATFVTDGQEPARLARLVNPSFEVTGPVTLTMDVADAEPVTPTVPDPGQGGDTVQRAFVAPMFVQHHDGGSLSSMLMVDGSVEVSLGHLGQRDVDGFVSTLAVQWAVPSANGGYDGSPSVYAILGVERGAFFDGFDRRYRQRDFATVRNVHHAQQPDRMASRTLAGRVPDGGAFSAGLYAVYPLPSTRTEFVAGEGARWGGALEQFHPDTGGEHELGYYEREFRPGRDYTERWNRPVFGPALPAASEPMLWLSRYDDVLLTVAPLHSDVDGHYGLAFTGTSSTTLYRDGVKIAETPGLVGEFAVPPEPAEYRVEARSAPGTELSSSVTAAWTFRSEHVDDQSFVRLPATAVRFLPRLDDGSAPGGRPFLMPIDIDRQGGPESDVRRVSVEVSYDDGATWRRVQLVGPGSRQAAGLDADQRAGARWIALLWHPRGPGHVSLRATATDRHGNSGEQTVIRAYRLR